MNNIIIRVEIVGFGGINFQITLPMELWRYESMFCEFDRHPDDGNHQEAVNAIIASLTRRFEGEPMPPADSEECSIAIVSRLFTHPTFGKELRAALLGILRSGTWKQVRIVWRIATPDADCVCMSREFKMVSPEDLIANGLGALVEEKTLQ